MKTLLFLIFITPTLIYGQNEGTITIRKRIPIDQNVFNKYILNQGWSLEDSTKKKPNEMFVVGFINDTISMAYIDWMEGLSGIYSKYKLSFRENFIEVQPTKWKSSIGEIIDYKKMKPIYIYCYLKNETTLGLLLKDKKINATEKLINDKEWMELILVKETTTTE